MNIGLTNDQDIAIVDSDLWLVTGIEEISQLCKQVLLSFEGDWFLNLDIGLPYFQTIFEKATNISAVENIYLDAIAAVPGILEIVTFRIDYDEKNRRADITFTANTSDGVLNFNLGAEG